MRDKKKHRFVFTEDEENESEILVKQLMSIKSIRKSRLSRYEKAYKEKLKQLEISRQTLIQHDKELQYSEENLISGKEFLLSKYLKNAVKMDGLREWSDKEKSLKKDVAEAYSVRCESHKQVTIDEEIAENAKKDYQKMLISIEKIDIFMEEVQSPT